MRMSLAFSNSTNTAFPSGDFMLIVIDRLLQLSIVKYRLSAFGTSRNCPRVASPTGDSSLITSAPIQASSCELVGPAWTCVMSRMRIPFNASIFLFCLPELFLDAHNGLFSLCAILLVHRLVRSAGRIHVAVDHDVDQRRHARVARFFERRPDLLRLRHANAESTHRLGQSVESHIAHDVADV